MPSSVSQGPIHDERLALSNIKTTAENLPKDAMSYRKLGNLILGFAELGFIKPFTEFNIFLLAVRHLGRKVKT
ncbi:MAG: hypothetical protein AAB441_02685 [Patescibacteria group bacterium]|nr:hypothetical protein CANDROIZ_100015 [Candidatus Roizmanbacteria bacterium]